MEFLNRLKCIHLEEYFSFKGNQFGMLKYNCNTDAIFSKCFGSILLKKENDPDRKPDHMRKSAILFYIIPHF